jgi:hypothetical protein
VRMPCRSARRRGHADRLRSASLAHSTKPPKPAVGFGSAASFNERPDFVTGFIGSRARGMGGAAGKPRQTRTLFHTFKHK